MERKWWQKPVRMIRRDFLGDFSVYKTADLEEMARETVEKWHCNCEWIMATPGCAPGMAHLTTFNGNGFGKVPGLGDFDIIKAYLPHAKKHGIRLVPYVNQHWYSYEFARAHPEFTQQMLEDGTPYGEKSPLYGNGTTFCINSPWREFAYEIIRETIRQGVDGCFLDGPVIFPGGCYCEHCRKLFKEQTGFDHLPSFNDWADEAWKPFLKFRKESWARFMKGAQVAAMEVNPEAVIFLNGGKFDTGSVASARDVAGMEPFQHFNGSEEFFHCRETYDSPFRSLNLGRFLSAGKNPAVVLTHHCMGGWHYVPMVETEMTMAMTQSVASGSNTWLAIYEEAMKHRAGEAFTANDIQKVFSENEEYITATESMANVALLTSANTLYGYISQQKAVATDVGSGSEENLVADLGSGKIREDASELRQVSAQTLNNELHGAFDAANFSHVSLKVLWDGHITDEKLENLPVLVLSNAACLSGEQCETIMRHVENGGSLLASFESGFYDENGDRANRDEWRRFLGVEKVEGSFVPSAHEEYMLMHGGKLPGMQARGDVLMPRTYNALKAVPLQGAEVLGCFMNPTGGPYARFSGASEYPALIFSKHGKGKVVYSPGTLFESFNRFHLEDHLNLYRAALRILSDDSRLQVETDAPGSLVMELRKNDQYTMLHLMNATGDMKRPIGKIVPLSDVKISIRMETEPRSAKCVVSGEELPFDYTAGRVEFSIPRIEAYELVVFG